MIAFLVFALAFLELGVTPVTSGCPKLSPMQVAISHDMRCLKKPSPVDKICSFGCPFGYFLRDDPNRGSFRFVCQKNGTWGGENHTCVDMWPPQIHDCPHSIIIIAKKGSPAEVVSWKVDVDDNSRQVDPNASVTVHSSHTSPYNFTIGRHMVSITATDKAGNTRTCQFSVTIRDIELPTCSFCPGDIVKVAKSSLERVSWDKPVCGDNSHLPVKFSVNYQNGQMFSVPGKYKVQYIVEDHAYPRPNVYSGCSFTITLKRPKCPMYPPPKNGALACLNRKDDDAALFCQVSCKDGTDFVFLPAMLYVCPYSGNWLPYSHFASNPRLPWPDCASGVGPSPLKTQGFSSFFFNGNQTQAEVVSEIKHKFLGFLQSPYVPPHFCAANQECSLDNVRVYI